jgi:tetratricopeptide (TPR) repeat protein
VNHYDKLGRQDKAMEIMGLMSELDLRNLDLDEGIQNFGDLFKEEEAENISYEQKEGCEEGVFKKVESGSFFDLNAELQTGTPIDLGGLKEVSTSEKPYGAQDLLKDLEKVNDSNFVYPDFHYQLGEAYLEMGSFDAAGEQFQLALENGQRPFEAAFMLGLLFKKENKWNEACRAFEKALDVKGIAEERKQEAKAELTLFGKELGKNK